MWSLQDRLPTNANHMLMNHSLAVMKLFLSSSKEELTEENKLLDLNGKLICNIGKWVFFHQIFRAWGIAFVAASSQFHGVTCFLRRSQAHSRLNMYGKRKTNTDRHFWNLTNYPNTIKCFWDKSYQAKCGISAPEGCQTNRSRRVTKLLWLFLYNSNSKHGLDQLKC